MTPPNWRTRYQHWRCTPQHAWSRRRTFWSWTIIAVIVPLAVTISFNLWVVDYLPRNR